MNRESLNTGDNLVGSVLLGRYRIVRELAKGGMGVVYLARSEGAVGFVKPVVIKLVLPEHAADERFLHMFTREAKILSQLRHPSIVDVIEFGEENGAYVMVLEYVRGYHLGQWSKYLRRTARRIPVDVMLLVMVDVLDALQKAHDMKHPDGSSMHIVHRDVSPSNILLDEDGRARLLDFGVARMRGGDYQTQVRGFVGKLTYSAPEMFGGEEATPESDVYSCGVVLHEMIHGRNVFAGKNQAETLQLVLNHVPESVEVRPDVPRGLDQIIAKATAKHPEDRFASALEFANALRSLQREHESSVRGRFAETLKSDFGEDMARVLGIESLTQRDEAWRRLSLNPPSLDEELSVGVPTVTDQGDTAHARPRQLSGKFNAAAPARTGSTGSFPRATPTTGSFQQPPRKQPSGNFPQPQRQQSTGNFPGVRSQPSGQFAPPPIPAELLNHVSGQQALAQSTGGITTGAAQASPAPSHPNRGLYIGLGGVACLAVAAIVVSLRATPLAQAPTMPAIRVVAETTQAPATVVQQNADPEIEQDVNEAAPATQRPGESRPAAAARPIKPDPASLTRAFRKQQGKVEACFKQHTASLQGVPQIQLEFDLNAAGKATSVAVSPSPVAATPLGKCLRAVGDGTRFPPQGEPVSFAIPITASRGAGGG